MGGQVQPFGCDEIKFSRFDADGPVMNIRPGPDGMELVTFAAGRVSETADSAVSLYSLPTEPDDDSVPAGCGTVVECRGRLCVLTARHCLFKLGSNEQIVKALGLGIHRMNSWRDGGQIAQGSVGLVETHVTSAGTAAVIFPEPNTKLSKPTPGLPDIALLVLSPEKGAELRDEHPHLRPWPLDTEHCGVSDDQIFHGFDLAIGGRSGAAGVENRRPYIESSQIVLDRVYERPIGTPGQYLSSFLAHPAGSPDRSAAASWKGSSGGGWWRIPLSDTGFDKILHGAPLKRDDLGEIKLLGVMFYEFAAPPAGRRVDRARFRGELIAHRLGPELIDFFAAKVDNADVAHRRDRIAMGAEAPGETGPAG